MQEYSKQSLFEFYLHLSKLEDEDKICFAYISPEESDNTLQLLLESIKGDMKSLAQQYSQHIKNGIYFGTIPRESKFYCTMNQFRLKAFQCLVNICCNY